MTLVAVAAGIGAGGDVFFCDCLVSFYQNYFKSSGDVSLFCACLVCMLSKLFQNPAALFLFFGRLIVFGKVEPPRR